MKKILYFFLFSSITGFSQSYIFPEPKIYNDSLRDIITKDTIENIYPVILKPRFATSTYESCDWTLNIFLPDSAPCYLIGKQPFHIEDSLGNTVGSGYSWEGVIQGNYTLHYISGYVLTLYMLNRGQIDGSVFHYYDISGKPPGNSMSYEKGKPLSELEYQQQKLWNVKKLYSSGGKKLKIGTFKNGNGILNIYRPNGTLLRTLTFIDGVLEGPCIYYYSTGAKMIEGNFVENLFDGIWKEYGMGGELVQEIKYEGGKLKSSENK